MKKLFLLAVLSAVVCGAAAHPNHIFGVRVGMNIANMTFKTGGVSATPNSVVRPLVAFSYEKSLMHTLPLYFETGLGIAGYGTSISDGAVKLNAYYFEAPALVNWRFGLTEDVSLIPYLGLSMRVGFAGKVKSGSAKADTFGDGGFDRFDMGVRAGIGVEYRRYSFRFGYDAGFLNLSDVVGRHGSQQDVPAAIGLPLLIAARSQFIASPAVAAGEGRFRKARFPGGRISALRFAASGTRVSARVVGFRYSHSEKESCGASCVRIDCRRICSDHRWAGFRATYVPDSGFGGPQARAEALRKGGKSPQLVCGTHFAHGASVKHPRKLCLRIFISSIFCAPIRRWPFSSPLRWVFWSANCAGAVSRSAR